MMNKKILFISITLVLMNAVTSAQTAFKEYKAGHVFSISLPDYMSKTAGINSSSTIQYKNLVKDVYGFVIEDSKDDLALAEMKFGSVKEFFEEFIKDFLKDEESRKFSQPKITQKGLINFAESDLTFFDKDAKTEIYYLIGIVETKTTWYKVISWCSAENKAKFKTDFQKILYSLKD